MGNQEVRFEILDLSENSRKRTVDIPDEMLVELKAFYKQGCYVMTGEEERFMSIESFNYNIHAILRDCGLYKVDFQMIHRTYEQGIGGMMFSNVNITGDSANIVIQEEKPIARGISVNNKRNENVHKKIYMDRGELMLEMRTDLVALRGLLGISSEEVCQIVGIPLSEYNMMEYGQKELSWNDYLALLFFYYYNERTREVVKALRLVPGEFETEMGMEIKDD